MAYFQQPAFFPYGAYAGDVHRWIDLHNPYLGFKGRKRLACIETYDPAPRVGEIGLGLEYEVGEGADEWSCSWLVTKPDNVSHWYQGSIEDTKAILVVDDSVFTVEGVYEIQAHLYRSGQLWPQPPVLVQCSY